VKRILGVDWMCGLLPSRVAVVLLVVAAAASSAAAAYAAKPPSPRAQLTDAINSLASLAQGAETASTTAQQSANELAPIIQGYCSALEKAAAQGQNPDTVPTGDSSGVVQLARQSFNRGYAHLVQDARRIRPVSRANRLVARLRKSHSYAQRLATLSEQMAQQMMQIGQSITSSDPGLCLSLPSVLRGAAVGLRTNGNLLTQDVGAMRQILTGASPGKAVSRNKTATVPG
jgi:hypothetical protein